MNHQIEDHVDVETPLRKRTEPMNLNKSRLGDERQRSDDRRVETLRMAGCDHRAPAPRGLEQPIGFFQRERDRFLNQHRHARLDQRQRQRHMGVRGCRDADGIDAARQGGWRRERLGPVFRRDLLSPLGACIDNADQIDTRHRRQQPRMVLPEMSDADDGDPEVAAHRPTIAIPASLAAVNTASPSSTSAFPASTDSAVAPADRIAVIVATPITGTSNRMS